MLHLVTTPAAFSVTTAWSPCKDPPGELSVYRGRGGAKGKSILFPPHFFSGSGSTIITLDFRERIVLGTNSAYFSDLLHSSSDFTQHLDLWSRDLLFTYRWQLADTISVVLRYQ